MEIFPKGRQGNPVLVYCDQVTDGGGWTVREDDCVRDHVSILLVKREIAI